MNSIEHEFESVRLSQVIGHKWKGLRGDFEG